MPPDGRARDLAIGGQARFLTPSDVAEELNTSHAQVMALVRSGNLAAIKIGGRGFWRIERSALEDYIAHCYEQTRQFVQEHPAQDDDLPAQ